VPTVLRWGPYRAFFYSNEGDEPAHVHVRAGGKEAKFWLHDLTIAINTGFPAHDHPTSESASRTTVGGVE
jgi:uncharacterized protein DUF4160